MDDIYLEKFLAAKDKRRERHQLNISTLAIERFLASYGRLFLRYGRWFWVDPSAESLFAESSVTQRTHGLPNLQL